jgi:hypothetical protein
MYNSFDVHKLIVRVSKLTLPFKELLGIFLSNIFPHI